MTEEALRGGFASGFWITGKLRRFYYTTAIDRSISQLGNTTADDNRDMAYSASVWIQPTTGEFGPRGGFGDLEHHDRARDPVRRLHVHQPRGAVRADRRSSQGVADQALRCRESVRGGGARGQRDGEQAHVPERFVRCGRQVQGILVPGRVLRTGVLSDFSANGPLPAELDPAITASSRKPCTWSFRASSASTP